MNLAVIGTGIVGQSIAGRLAELGHAVTIGTRDVAATRARTEPGPMGSPPISEWLEQHPAVTLATLAEAATGADIVVNATAGEKSIDALTAAGAANLDGKVVIDIANPLDFSAGMPPTLSFCNTDSLGERIQHKFPGARVVKALNTMSAFVMVDPKQLAGGDHTVFVCGNDDAAKATVTEILLAFGWSDIIDLGDITAARGTEMVLPIWLRLWGALQAPTFNFKVVR